MTDDWQDRRMTVGQLIAMLQVPPSDMEVYIEDPDTGWDVVDVGVEPTEDGRIKLYAVGGYPHMIDSYAQRLREKKC